MKAKIIDYEPFEGSDFGKESQAALKRLLERSCNHKAMSDMSYTTFSGEKVIHKYCNTCGMHFYKDKEYTKKEWDSWIESCDFKN